MGVPVHTLLALQQVLMPLRHGYSQRLAKDIEHGKGSVSRIGQGALRNGSLLVVVSASCIVPEVEFYGSQQSRYQRNLNRRRC